MDRVLIGVRGLGSGPGRAMELRWKRLVADGASMMDVTQNRPKLCSLYLRQILEMYFTTAYGLHLVAV